ncbi:MAG: hypothetical protein AAF555_05630 [Verrucomicrobiota bacterium]
MIENRSGQILGNALANLGGQIKQGRDERAAKREEREELLASLEELAEGDSETLAKAEGMSIGALRGLAGQKLAEAGMMRKQEMALMEDALMRGRASHSAGLQRAGAEHRAALSARELDRRQEAARASELEGLLGQAEVLGLPAERLAAVEGNPAALEATLRLFGEEQTTAARAQERLADTAKASQRLVSENRGLLEAMNAYLEPSEVERYQSVANDPVASGAMLEMLLPVVRERQKAAVKADEQAAGNDPLGILE